MDLANYSVLEKTVFDNVYEPAEDTFILVDALEQDQNLIKSIRPRICLEIGCGSGVVITTLGKVLGSAYYLCTDLNPLAAEATIAVSKSNKVSVDVVVTDLVQSLRGCLENSVDLIICNPPYAVTPNEEVGGDNLQKATSGGERGRQVIDRLFPIIPKLLSPGGLFYLTCIYENDISKALKLKKAKEEAQAEVLRFREEKDKQFKEYEKQHMGSKESSAQEIERSTTQNIEAMKHTMATNKGKVIQYLIEKVFDVEPEVHKNFRYV